jgi:hypothetical protein
MRWWLPIFALLLPMPAHADVTARYKAGSRGDVVTIEVDSGGNARAGIEGQFVLIRRDGIDYVVVPDRAGAPRVTRADAALAAMVARAGPRHTGNWRIEPAGKSETIVAGYSGTMWRFGPDDGARLELLMSADPALAPIGDLFRRIAEAFAAAMQSKGGGNVIEAMQALFAHGTPIRIEEPLSGALQPGPDRMILSLESVSMAEIDARRFDLPGPVLLPDAFFAALAPPPPTDGSPLDLPMSAPVQVPSEPAIAPK